MRHRLLALSAAVLAAAGLAGLPALGSTKAADRATVAGSGPGKQVWRSYVSSGALGADAGEPTLGLDSATGTVLFQSGLQTLRVTDFDKAGPGTASWANVAPFTTGTFTLDPLLKRDNHTGRTFVSQLTAACSLLAYTDDNGKSWTNSQMGCGVGTAVDHQSMGAGAYRQGSQASIAAALPTAYPDVVYYCAQDIASANCAWSIDGGATFGAANVAYSDLDCGGLFGHLKSAPDGTIYLPPERCGSGVGLAVSEDNGTTWSMHKVPRALNGDGGHPSVAIARDGTVYYAWSAKDGATGGPVQVSLSHDKAKTWTEPVSLGSDKHIQNTRFPVVVAGDGDRATVAYLGSTEGGDANGTAFLGAWHLYASTTYNRGASWSTVDITPTNPVQIGSVCTKGTTCGNDRNMLDFNDMVLDQQGYPWIAFSRGCTDPGVCSPAVRKSQASIARMVGGVGLYAKTPVLNRLT